LIPGRLAHHEFKPVHPNIRRPHMLRKKTVVALSVAALAASTAALPAAAAGSVDQPVQLAGCGACKAKKGCGACGAKKGCGACGAKKGCGACGAKKGCGACGAKKK
jgi:hypothetical protein